MSTRGCCRCCACSFKHGFWVERPDSTGSVARVPAMLKVKDWPPRSAFTQEMQRHFVVRLTVLRISKCLVMLTLGVLL
jgi:hypothetical protein